MASSDGSRLVATDAGCLLVSASLGWHQRVPADVDCFSHMVPPYVACSGRWGSSVVLKSREVVEMNDTQQQAEISDARPTIGGFDDYSNPATNRLASTRAERWALRGYLSTGPKLQKVVLAAGLADGIPNDVLIRAK